VEYEPKKKKAVWVLYSVIEMKRSIRSPRRYRAGMLQAALSVLKNYMKPGDGERTHEAALAVVSAKNTCAKLGTIRFTIDKNGNLAKNKAGETRCRLEMYKETICWAQEEGARLLVHHIMWPHTKEPAENAPGHQKSSGTPSEEAEREQPESSKKRKM
ncbi:MAG: uncharacterized protein A8A55_3267, partial [Amphiamblys sp. WSBS2006]